MSARHDTQAALLREAFIEVASAGWRAHEIGMTEQEMLYLIAATMEPLVEVLTKQLVKP